MKPLGDSNVHYWLAQRMARATETDLVAAMQKAGLTQEDWAQMVADCRGCKWTRGCERWLVLHRDEAAEEAPSDCLNHDRFEVLKSALEAIE